MGRRLNNDDFDKILSVIDYWEGKLTWDKLCDSVTELIGKRPTRQSLNSHPQIKEAFLLKKKRLKNESSNYTELPASLEIAAKKNKKLEDENARLNQTLESYVLKFITWQKNASDHGLTKDDLEKPLIEINRRE